MCLYYLLLLLEIHQYYMINIHNEHCSAISCISMTVYKGEFCIWIPVYISVYMRMCDYEHIYIHIYIGINTYIYLKLYIHTVCVFIHIHTNMHICLNSLYKCISCLRHNIGTVILIFVRTNSTYTYMFFYIHIQLCTCTFIRIKDIYK
jgi:hypothetical protein